jgi:hypothetical protein
MKYGANLYFNQDRLAMLGGFRQGDPLKLSTLIIFPEAIDPQGAAEIVFRLANADDRPNGKTERSMSVGDVVKIIGVAVPEPAGWAELNPEKEWDVGDIHEWWFACDPVGFRAISNPFQVSNDE